MNKLKIAVMFLVVMLSVWTMYILGIRSEESDREAGKISSESAQNITINPEGVRELLKADKPVTHAGTEKQLLINASKDSQRLLETGLTDVQKGSGEHTAVDTSSPGTVFSQQDLGDGRQIAKDENAILLQVGVIDTSKGPVNIPEGLRFDSAGVEADETIRYLVQFRGPVLSQWKEEVQIIGGEFGDYIPNNAFIISLTSNQKDILTNLPFVQWIDYYHPAYKISSSFRNPAILKKAQRYDKRHFSADSSGSAATSDPPSALAISGDVDPTLSNNTETSPGTISLLVQTYSHGQLPYLYSIADTLDSVSIIHASDERKSRVVLEVQALNLDEVLLKIAPKKQVEWVEPFVPPSLNNDKMHWLAQSNIPDADALWSKGLTGKGQIIGVGDTGLDADMVFFWDEAAGLPTSVVNHNQRKVISYHDLAGNGDWDNHDHGTHVAGTIAGKSTGINSEYNGVAYDAKLVIQDIGNGGVLTGIPGDLGSYFQQAYNDGARVHSNSWGSAVGGAYTSYSQDADQFMWDNKDFLIVFSAGNSGPDSNTIGSPGTAKNVLTSGASENAHSGYNPENVAYFSSNGPTDDGRVKPTVTISGHYLTSANSDGQIASYNSDVRTMSGTSMSAPAHAGSAALVRQYYVDGYYPTGSQKQSDVFQPSAALIKATMVNSAVDMKGEYTDGQIPSTGQGWGRILLDNTLFFQGDTHSLFVDDVQNGLNNGQQRDYTFFSDGTEPIKITLAWTDRAPSMSAAIQLVNDLDLIVSGPSSAYYGNAFSLGSSIEGGAGDRLNVVENILIINPEKGAYTVTINALNVPLGPQPYAIVVTGLSAGSKSGEISFNQKFYKPGGTAMVSLNDLDLNVSSGIDTATVRFSSEIDPGREVTLLEMTPNSGTFTGSFIINETVNVEEDKLITVSYVDTEDSTGGVITVTDNAIIDSMAPFISNVVIDNINENSAVISWQTDEQTVGHVFFRKESETTWLKESASAEGLAHTVALTGLEIGTIYELKIGASDRAGNETIANGGEIVTFSTDIEHIAFYDPVEQEVSLFHVTGGSNDAGENGLWHQSTYKSGSGTASWYYGLETTKTYDTATWNWGHITTVTPIDLTNLKKPRLKFNHILTTENYDPYDMATVQISENNLLFETVYRSTASSFDWEEVTIDLNSYAGKNIYIRFNFDTADEMYNDYEGWLVDDIKVVSYHKKQGDIDSDGKITMADLLISLQLMSGMNVSVPMTINADVNNDGLIGLPEAIQILQELSR